MRILSLIWRSIGSAVRMRARRARGDACRTFHLAVLFVSTIACGGDENGADAAALPDAAVFLTSGQVCDGLTEATCARDIECFDGSLGTPCPDGHRYWCCEMRDRCDLLTGSTQADVDRCKEDLLSATCAELQEQGLPESCVAIATPLEFLPDAGAAVEPPRGKPTIWRYAASTGSE